MQFHASCDHGWRLPVLDSALWWAQWVEQGPQDCSQSKILCSSRSLWWRCPCLPSGGGPRCRTTCPGQSSESAQSFCPHRSPNQRPASLLKAWFEKSCLNFVSGSVFTRHYKAGAWFCLKPWSCIAWFPRLLDEFKAHRHLRDNSTKSHWHPGSRSLSFIQCSFTWPVLAMAKVWPTGSMKRTSSNITSVLSTMTWNKSLSRK